MRLGLLTHVFARRKPFLVLPAAAIVVALLAVAFHEATGKGIEEVLFSGQDALTGLTAGAATWSISALLLLLLFKGLAWGVSLGSFRGGPTFPALFIGAAAGILASHLPGFDLTAAVAVGMGAGAVSVLRLPLSCVVLASLLVSKSGAGLRAADHRRRRRRLPGHGRPRPDHRRRPRDASQAAPTPASAGQ